MKNFLKILILSLSSCSKKPPKPYVFKPDSEATNIGNSTKTPNYIFASGFIQVLHHLLSRLLLRLSL